jgi:flavin reductase (DIM6/NTAB) family NADH-FMN oxidoreductase RutF
MWVKPAFFISEKYLTFAPIFCGIYPIKTMTLKKITMFAAVGSIVCAGCGDKPTASDMKSFAQISVEDVNISAPKLIGQDWMLITAGRDTTDFNTMTASWGTLGHLWGRNVAFVFIRPQRYTKEFVDANAVFTLSFFDEQYRKALQICGTKSGRNTNKVQEAGITPIATPAGSVAFGEAKMVLECRKLYSMPIDSASFIDKSLIGEHYPDKDFHIMYVGEIVNAYKK